MRTNRMAEFRVAFDDMGIQFCVEYLTFHDLRREYCVVFNRRYDDIDHIDRLADKGFQYTGNFEYNGVTVETYKHKDDL